jgi:hypothetical protein
MITFKRWSRFYSRTSAGKYPLNVSEIRSAVLASDTVNERVRLFRLERLAKIVAAETPVSIGDPPLLVLHVVPLSALDMTAQIDLSDFQRLHGLWPPLFHSGSWTSRINFDGFVSP